jgi:hypothetical protein
MKINEPEDWPEARAVSESPAEAFPENFGIRLKFIRHFIDETMSVDTQVTRGIRVRNEGFASVISNAPNPVLLNYHWMEYWGNSIIHKGIRSQFPISVLNSRPNASDGKSSFLSAQPANF